MNSKPGFGVRVRADLEVDMDGATLVPARVDGGERRDAVSVGSLEAPQEVGAGAALDAGVDAERVAMPDVDDGALEREASVAIDLRHEPAEFERDALCGRCRSPVFGRMSDRSRLTST